MHTKTELYIFKKWPLHSKVLDLECCPLHVLNKTSHNLRSEIWQVQHRNQNLSFICVLKRPEEMSLHLQTFHHPNAFPANLQIFIHVLFSGINVNVNIRLDLMRILGHLCEVSSPRHCVPSRWQETRCNSAHRLHSVCKVQWWYKMRFSKCFQWVRALSLDVLNRLLRMHLFKAKIKFPHATTLGLGRS